MARYLLCFHHQTDPAQALPWQEPLEQFPCSLLRTKTLHEAKTYCRAYPLVMALVRFHERTPELVDAVRDLAAAIPEGKRLALIGLSDQPLAAADRAELCAAGLCDFLAAEDPPAIVLWRLEILSLLADLDQFAKARMDVGELAKKTRERLHDMSQPLTAVQGRLQLLAAKATPEDPNAEYYREMVRLMAAATRQIAEMQQLHRAFS
ncbi:MAG TPA: hypothetical protein PLS90_01185 [Candidatus Sumerlaeota bacterium]|mgnify:CR=1 FL=1|nr:hypothetical protein [Candidatus Sumerlaeota bacterium]HPK01045.1 hypothetical protein [Candidatus Sumerlaeota bacterium]